jgi:hypothetical protein
MDMLLKRWFMPVKSLITFQNQALQQLGIDPAFGEAGSGPTPSAD